MGTAARQQLGLRTDSLGGLHWVGIVAALVTAAIHLLLGVRPIVGGDQVTGLQIGFVLAGLGFLGAIALVLIDYRRRTVYAVGIPFTLVQLLLWYVVNFASGPYAFPGDVGPLDAVDKVAQVVLVAVLVMLLR